MKKVIYLVGEIIENDLYKDISNINLPRVYGYAKKVDAKVVILGKDHFKAFQYDARLDFKSKAYHMLFECFKHFVFSPFDQMLYIDTDVFIADNSPNIFELLTQKENFWLKHYIGKNGYKDSWLSSSELDNQIMLCKFYEEYFNWKKENINICCTGVILADKNVITELCKVIPVDWSSHTDLLISKSSNGIYKGLPYEDLYSYFVHDTGKSNLTLEKRAKFVKINSMDHLQLTTLRGLYKEKFNKEIESYILPEEWNFYPPRDLSTLKYFNHFTGTRKENLKNYFTE